MEIKSEAYVGPVDEDVQENIYNILEEMGLKPASLDDSETFYLDACGAKRLEDGITHMVVHIEPADLAKPFRRIEFGVSYDEAHAILNAMKDRVVRGARQSVHLADRVIWAETEEEAAAIAATFRSVMSKAA